MGDWNMTPEEMAASGFPTFIRVTIVHTGGITCRQGRGTIIDYAVVHHEIAGATKVKPIE